MRRTCTLTLLVISGCALLYGQITGKQSDPSGQASPSSVPLGQITGKKSDPSDQTSPSSVPLSTQLAMSNPNYPVTPGDVYKIAYFSANQEVSIPLTIESDYSVNLGLFGRLKVENLSYVDLKRVVEKKITDAYQNSTPSLSIVSVGVFQVYIKGEVDSSAYVNAWGLTKLSEVIKPRVTAYASIRDIQVTSSSGNSRSYDLFRAERFGESSSDPFLRSGDVIIARKADRRIALAGEIRRPGTYQLLSTENLKDLIDVYGDGFKQTADLSRVRVDRLYGKSSEAGALGKTFFLNLTSDTGCNFELNDLDSVVISSKLLSKPVVFFEGAIGSKREAAVPPESNRIRYGFFPGEQISSPVRSFNESGLFSAESALDKSYIIREGEAQPFAINLEMLLYNYQPENDKDLHSGDLIVIPFRQYSITVGGAVNKPGRYPYVPNRSWRYYVNLAGGIDEDKNAGGAIEIRDIEDKVKLKESEIQPEDKIVALANNPLYIFGKFSAILTSVVSLTSLVISVIVLLK